MYSLAIVSALYSCNEGIDPISKVDPGDDATAPVITITYPAEGTQIQRPETVSSVNIQFEVTDDIEIASIKVLINGTEIASYNEFKDYRRVIEELLYDNVTNGAHILTINATDLEGKTTSTSVNFEKSPPYTPQYDGEIFYMPFDGDYMDMISFETATEVGTPGFAGQSLAGLNAYAGASNSYLTFPADKFTNNELSAVFWMKINAVPDRAGILVMGPPDEANPDKMNNRKHGFRFFRENAGGKQRFKLNAGTGTSDSWFDGGSAADVDPSLGTWVNFAFTISSTECIVYIDGQEVKKGDFAGIDWTGCDVLSIMSGAPRFNGWNHNSDLSFMDELRIFDKALSKDEIQNIITTETGKEFDYTPLYDGEIFYMPFDGSNKELVSGAIATEVGTPGFAGESVRGEDAFAGATDSYLTFPTEGLQGSELSATFWYKVNPDPDRAGILSVGASADSRKEGFRLFREGNAESQRIKLNVGIGTGESWNDGDLIDVTAGEWVHIAIAISADKNTIYFNGEEKRSSDMTAGIDWTGCSTLTIGAGGETFSYWNHLSDLSNIDELRLYNKALSQTEIQTIMNND